MPLLFFTVRISIRNGKQTVGNWVFRAFNGRLVGLSCCPARLREKEAVPDMAMAHRRGEVKRWRQCCQSYRPRQKKVNFNGHEMKTLPIRLDNAMQRQQTHRSTARIYTNTINGISRFGDDTLR